MKIIINFILPLALLASASGDEGNLHRLAALVDYVAADYPGAVKDGAIIAQTEYDEQRSLIADAKELASDLHSPAVTDALVKIESDVATRSPALVVETDCRSLRTLLVEKLGLVLTPTAPPSLDRAKTLYQNACASCHGADGHADTEQAKKLTPKPLSFFETDRMARISPSLAFHALTFGVKNTAMASFDSLPASDRWSLAFYVVAMRHLGIDQKNIKARDDKLGQTASRLAQLSDADLAAAYSADPNRDEIIAYLRATSSFATDQGGMFSEARRLLSALTTATTTKEKRDLAVAAYLEGIEPHESSLRARDPQLTEKIERDFIALRQSVSANESADQLAKRVGAIFLLLDRAEAKPASASMVFVAAFTIALREGLEAALLIAALLAFLRKSGRSESAKLVHLGWLAAIPVGFASWWLAGRLVDGARRELVEAVITLLAAVMIVMVSHWILGKEDAKHWLGFLRRRVEQAAPNESGWPLFFLAFIAAYREAFEVVLFYRALLLDAGERASSVAAGAATGCVAIFVVVFLFARLGRRLNPRPVMLVSSALLAVLALALVGRAVRSLQEGGYLALTPAHFPDLSTIGIYPSREGLFAQSIMVLAIFTPSLIDRLKNKKNLLQT